MNNDENTKMETRNRSALDIASISSAKTQLEGKPLAHQHPIYLDP